MYEPTYWLDNMERLMEGQLPRVPTGTTPIDRMVLKTGLPGVPPVASIRLLGEYSVNLRRKLLVANTYIGFLIARLAASEDSKRVAAPAAPPAKTVPPAKTGDRKVLEAERDEFLKRIQTQVSKVGPVKAHQQLTKRLTRTTTELKTLRATMTDMKSSETTKLALIEALEIALPSIKGQSADLAAARSQKVNKANKDETARRAAIDERSERDAAIRQLYKLDTARALKRHRGEVDEDEEDDGTGA